MFLYGAMGDWSRGSVHGGARHLPGMMPTMTMGIVDAFRARGYTIGFIDESYTSKLCSRPGCRGARVPVDYAAVRAPPSGPDGARRAPSAP
ncbi:hypothetical protein KFE25_010510 [Diacronema lutheri]|uniref:Uncharacterized protein n=1 Tax=Diacronema lutheri TaxID=2081491 RepID=A0A8J5XCU0_DIALT|nr:hypothetical protein KFE25_010510 [Diacronema lutheri]